MSGSHLSKDFFELVKSIGESKSKQEEDRIIVHEVGGLKKRMSEGGAPNKKRRKEFLVRLMYVEMLGHDASFGYIKAVEMTASTNLLQKRVGYLCCSLTLSPDHEFRFMIVNQLQRDLKSSNYLEVCSALIAVSKLVTPEMIPAVLPMVVDLLRHDADIVRKKAVMALHRFHQLSPESVSHLGDKLRRTLCDKDPSVMGAALNILHGLAKANAQEYKDLVPSYVSILKQITEHRLPREFDYHRIPAPWIQIRLLKILSLLGQADQQTSEGMYEVLHDVMRRADTGINVGYAIIYECVRTVTTIYPNSTLLDAAAASISRFISSDNHNLKYLGVTGLAAIVKDHPRYATAHQIVVVDCLEDPDETLKRKTLDLLYRMTNPVNVEFISDKLTQFLRETTDEYLRTELVSRITQCAERYAPSNAWYIQTMTNVFELGGELVRPEVAHNLLRLIAEGSGEDEDLDMELRKDAVETYLELLDTPVLPDVLVRVMAWVLGEYGYLSTTMPLAEICERLCELMERPFSDEDATRTYIVSAVMKLSAQYGQRIPAADALMTKYTQSRDAGIQQRCIEYVALRDYPDVLTEVFPVDASCEDIEVDPNLDFLSAFVAEKMAGGAKKYNPPSDSDSEGDDYRRRRGSDRLNFEAYQKPELPYNSTTYTARPSPAPEHSAQSVSGTWGCSNAMGSADGLGGQQGGGLSQDSAIQYAMARKGIKNVWGPTGLNTSEAHQSPPGGSPPQHHPPQSQYTRPPSGLHPYEQAQTHQQQYFSQQQQCARSGYSNEEEEEEDDYGNSEISEKQQMANALFGGMPGAPAGGAQANGGRQGGRNRRSSGRRSQGGKRAPTGKSSEMGRSGNEVEPPHHQLQQSYHHQQPQPQQRGDVDLLDMNFGGSPAPSLVQQPQSQHYNDSSRHGAFSMGGMSSELPSVSNGEIGSLSYNGAPIQPMKLSTSDFGGRWGGLKCEKKAQIPQESIRSLDDCMGRIQILGLFPIEAIAQTNECIAAGGLGNGDMICLIHAKLRSSGHIDLTVRTSNQDFCDQMVSLIGHRLH